MKISPDWKQAAMDAAGSFNYGDIITMEWLQGAFDLTPPAMGSMADYTAYHFKFLSFFDNFREKLLEDNKMYLKSVRGHGYLVVEVEDQTSVAWGEFRAKIHKSIAKVNMALRHVNSDLLSNSGKVDNHNKLATLAALSSFNKKEVFNDRKLLQGAREDKIPVKKAGRTGLAKAAKKEARGEKCLPLRVM